MFCFFYLSFGTHSAQWFESLEIATLELAHSPVSSLVRWHRPLTRLLRSARFARALHRARSLTHSLPSSWAKGILVSFEGDQNHSAVPYKKGKKEEKEKNKKKTTIASAYYAFRPKSQHNAQNR